jgi:hypothetical protein
MVKLLQEIFWDGKTKCKYGGLEKKIKEGTEKLRL